MAEKKKGDEAARRQKEKEEADKAEQDKEAKAKAAREKKKKERDAQRKEEQEAKKKQEEEARQKEVAERQRKEATAKEQQATAAGDTAPPEDEEMPDENINDHLNEINSGGGDEEMEEPSATTASPKKKKSRRDKKQRKKDKAAKEKEDQAKVAKTFAEAARSPSLMKTGRYSAGGGAAEKANQAKRKEMAMHIHQFPRWILELSIKLTSEDKHSEFTLAIRQLLENAQRVCPNAVIAPAKEGHCDPLYFTGDVNFNFSILNRHVKIQDAHKAFNPKKPWGKDKEDVEPEDPVVYFSLAFSTDEDPDDVIEGVAGEWSRSNGIKMYRKKLDSFKTQTPACFFYVLNAANPRTISAEVKAILEEARDNLEMDPNEDSFLYAGCTIPPLSTRVNVPQIKGQDTTIYKGWNNKQQWNRKVIHLEVDKEHVEMISYLCEAASTQGLWTKRWGKKAKCAVLADSDEAKLNLKSLMSFAKKHVNYEASMTYSGLVGVMALDTEVAIKSVTDPDKVVGTLTFREMLYTLIKLKGNPPIPLFCEVHQFSPVSAIDAVIPNCPEAETMLEMMNKHIAAFLFHYLQTVVKMDEGSVMALLSASVDPSLLHTIGECTWDEKTWVLTTPDDKEREEEAAMEQAAWYKDQFASTGKNKKAYANSELMFKMTDEHSVTTIHERPGRATYEGSPGAPTIDLSGDKATQESANDDGSASTADARFLAMSKEELLALLKEQGKNKGSQPMSVENKSSSDDSSSGSESSDSASDSESDASSDEEAAGSERAASKG
jgi:hypothetical protein